MERQWQPSLQPEVFGQCLMAGFDSHHPLHKTRAPNARLRTCLASTQTYMKNVLTSDNSRYVLRAVMAGKQGERDTVIWNAINLSCYLVDEDGRRYWGWVRQGWFAGMGTQAQWSVRDLHANKLTLFCFTYVARDTGVILAQNATSMATFGGCATHCPGSEALQFRPRSAEGSPLWEVAAPP